MPDLTAYLPSRILYRAAWGSYVESWTLYILSPGLTDCAQVPEGHTLGVVYSSNNYASPGRMENEWHYVRFVVVYQQIEHVDKMPTRYYRELKEHPKRLLTAGEIAYFEALIETGEILRESA